MTYDLTAHVGAPENHRRAGIRAAVTEQPTQPDEPTNFGACVEVAGVRYLRGVGDTFPWLQEVEADWFRWSHLIGFGPVTVLHEGWTP